jgi:hypothetical protein
VDQLHDTERHQHPYGARDKTSKFGVHVPAL